MVFGMEVTCSGNTTRLIIYGFGKTQHLNAISIGKDATAVHRCCVLPGVVIGFMAHGTSFGIFIQYSADLLLRA